MLFFLRQVRRKLMNENKFTTYLLYAIGEIILVVVGILIAVQIDEWNKDQEAKATAKSFLINLDAELGRNKVILEEIIQDNSSVILAGRRILNIIGFDTIQYDETEMSGLVTAAFAPIIIFQPNETVLSELTTSGNIKNLENPKLKSSLSTFSSHLDVVRFQESIVQQDKELCINELRRLGSMRTMFDISGASAGYLEIYEGGKSNGNKKLLESNVFENNLLIYTASSTGLNNQYKATLVAMDSLSILIYKEINK